MNTSNLIQMFVVMYSVRWSEYKHFEIVTDLHLLKTFLYAIIVVSSNRLFNF